MPISEQSITPLLRRAIEDDLDFLVWIDVHGEGGDPSYMAVWTDAECSDHRLMMLGFICDADKFAFVLQSGDCRRIGGICGRFVDILGDLCLRGVFSINWTPRCFQKTAGCARYFSFGSTQISAG